MKKLRVSIQNEMSLLTPQMQNKYRSANEQLNEQISYPQYKH